jgi:predicted metal-dependent HD superfamily phosphohydrolase
MKAIYNAANPIDAQLVSDLLADAGIQTHVQGSFLVGGIGELPAGEMMRIWVADEAAGEAKRIIAEHDRGDTAESLEMEMMPALRASWRRMWSALGAPGEGLVLMERLLDAWSEPQRRYHTLQHLADCLARLEPHLHLAQHPGEVEFALWMHDAIYDVRGKDNECQSAQWAASELQAVGQPQAVIDRVQALVMATCHDALPRTADERLLVDVDLSILGASPARFDDYEAQVREEYAWVPGWVFRRKRSEILAQFLSREHLFNTEVFRNELEAQARHNLQRSISALRPWWRRF